MREKPRRNRSDRNGDLKKNRLENVDFNRFPKSFFGGFWIRFLAYMTDVLIINALSGILLNLTFNRLFGLGFAESFWAGLIELAIFVLYFFLTTHYLDGQTLGKMLFRLRVVPLKEEKSLKKFFLLREVFGKAIFYYFPYIGVLLVFSFRRQHPIDILVDSVVINEGKLEEMERFRENVKI